ncbi:type II toxin-antitoxin system RelE/ParE family toxin [Psychromonas sp. SP041]|uniref:type II toxin-antitoxin system RelE/ParE family toxin n=1 Tax=Psychromonas sp. SP041 TaxID=1365007 RepID=UPI0010C7D075|nr:type II toxin-antitoxin system RelE/ParE family toxin [Psychromonas sp. SP041]
MIQTVIEYTETFSNSTDLAITHFSLWNDEIRVLDKIEDTINIFEDSVSANPLIYSVSASLFDIAGLTSIREANINGYRLLYELNERDNRIIITALLLLGERQSIKEQLVKHCLMYK